ncbi:MAG: class I SAM-dependent methyltransferase, partial [Lachnospiraceae bacterium]|nr:class I SAM-dependent methyltransferase [Lachnospiraceae bacterium]
VAGMVTRGNVVCDVGCDHGFTAIYLVQQGISPRALAMDLREGPLSAAGEHIAACGLEERIETRLSDGLHKYKTGEADTLICAGMGGGLMMRILAREREKTDSFRELVLQPQSELEQFRRFLRENGYRIQDEEILQEEGKFYQVIRAVTDRERESHPGSAEVSGRMDFELCKLEDRYGPVLLQKRTPVFLSFLEREEAICEEILARLRSQGLADDKRRERYEEVETQRQDCRRARNLYS